MSNHDKPTPAGAVIYLRAGGDNADAVGSITRQHDACIAMAARLGVCVERVSVDRSASGSRLNRPGLMRLLDDIATHEVAYVITADLSRLAPAPRSKQILGRLWAHGCRIALAESEAIVEPDTSLEPRAEHQAEATDA